jgi:RNA polymerase sigma factor (sigma-70 family)
MPGPPPPGSSIESVIQRFSRMVLSIGRRAGLVESDLDELIQEVRLRLWRKQNASTQETELPATYVHQAARSAAIDIVRARRSRMADATQTLDTVTIADRISSPDVAIEEREAADRIMQVVDELAADRRAAVKLHLAGYRREEISAMLGWNDVRTRNLVHRGLQDVRDRLIALGLAPAGDD